MEAGKFERAVELTLRHEGGYVNDPKDPGGETNFGISKRSYPQIDIKRLTRTEAVVIYRNDYWYPSKADRILNELLSSKVFDLSVNCGVAAAVKMLQRSVNKSGGSLVVDGVAGPKTLSAVNNGDTVGIFSGLLREAYAHYEALSKRSPQYFAGWIKRLWSF